MAVSAPRRSAVYWRGLFLWQSGFFAAAGSQESLRAYIENFSPYSHLCFFLIQFLSVILAPIPSNVSALAGGVLFGTWVSFLLTFSAVATGSLLVFSLARGLGRDAVTRLVGRKVSEKYLDVIHAKTDIFLVLAFLFPFFPGRRPVYLGRTHPDLLPPVCGHHPVRPALGAPLCQRSGRRLLLHPRLGHGPDRRRRSSPLSAGDEVRRPGGGRHPPPPAAEQRLLILL